MTIFVRDVAGVSVARLHVQYTQPHHLHGVQPRVQEHVSAAVALSLLRRRRRVEAGESVAAAGTPEPVPSQRQRDARVETTRRHVLLPHVTLT